MRRYANREYTKSLCGFFLREPLEGLVEDRIAGRRRLTELHVRVYDAARGLQPLFVQRRTGRSEIARGREPHAAAVRQLDQPLDRGASDGVLADELGAVIPGHR